MHLDKSTASRLIDALERLGYVRKMVSSEDARALSLEVTPKGKALHDKIERDMVEQMRQLLADFEPDVRGESARLLSRLAEAATARFAGIPDTPS